MVPKAVSDAGYTAVGLGVLAVQQVQARRRETRAGLEAQARQARERVESVLGELKAKVEPMAAQLDRLPRLPGPLGRAVDGGRERLQRALRPADRG